MPFGENLYVVKWTFDAMIRIIYGPGASRENWTISYIFSHRKVKILLILSIKIWYLLNLIFYLIGHPRKLFFPISDWLKTVSSMFQFGLLVFQNSGRTISNASTQIPVGPPTTRNTPGRAPLSRNWQKTTRLLKTSCSSCPTPWWRLLWLFRTCIVSFAPTWKGFARRWCPQKARNFSSTFDKSTSMVGNIRKH